MDEIRFERADDVMVIRLARSAKKNALTGAMYDALTTALVEIESQDAIGAVLITGTDGVFCAGNDLADFIAFAGQPGEKPPFRFIKALATQSTPLVAAVDGPAVGIGTTMLLHCDLVYAAPGATFRLPFVDLGLVPEAASTLILPRLAGHAKAAELLLLAESFDAAEAHRIGIVNKVVGAETLEAEALARAKALAKKPRAAIAATRRLLRGDTMELVRVIEAEGRAFEEALTTPEARAAFERFLSRPKESGSRAAAGA